VACIMGNMCRLPADNASALQQVVACDEPDHLQPVQPRW
jgi:hypothetical protein